MAHAWAPGGLRGFLERVAEDLEMVTDDGPGWWVAGITNRVVTIRRLAALLPEAAELAEMAKACSIGAHLACLHDLPEDEARLRTVARLLRALSGEEGRPDA